MVAINPKKNLHFGENSPEIHLNSNLKRWFSRNIGLWKSNRTYFLDEAQKTYNLSMNITFKLSKVSPNGNRIINSLGIQKKNIISLTKILSIKNEEKCMHF